MSIGLPLLDGMAWAKEARKIKPRMCFTFFHYGVPMPPDTFTVDNKQKLNEAEFAGQRRKYDWFPTGEGNDFQFTDSHKCLEPLRDKLTYFGGLSHPPVRKMNGHALADIFLTGGDLTGGEYRQSISIDQVAAAVIGEQTRFSCLAFSSDGGTGRRFRSTTLSYDREGRPIPSEHRPKDIFQRLFGEDSAGGLKKRRTELETHASILDAVREEAASLNRRLGRRDQEKMDEYLSSVREVEKSVVRAQDWLNVQKPQVDPGSVNLEADVKDVQEFLRSKYDLMALAFQTDSTRIVTYQTCNENDGGASKAFPAAAGVNATAHNVSHQPQNFANLCKYTGFLLEQHAYFLHKLNSIKEGEGTLLDNTMALYGSGTSYLHLARNYPLLLAGGGNLGLAHGHYRKYSEDVPLSNLYLAMLNRMGLPAKSFKGSTGALDLLS